MISPNTYKKLNNTGLLSKAENRLVYWCHKYICLRDLYVVYPDDLICRSLIGFCISCRKKYRAVLYSDGSIMNGREWHAGHFYKANMYESVRFDERNLNGQCSQCNRYMHGNEANYQVNLIEKIGEEEFNRLTVDRHKLKKFNIIEIETMTETFKIKAKAEAKRLNTKI